MKDYGDIFSDKDHYGKPFALTLADVTEKAKASTEKAIGYVLPPSYLEFVRTRNGEHVLLTKNARLESFSGLAFSLWNVLQGIWTILVNVSLRILDFVKEIGNYVQ